MLRGIIQRHSRLNPLSETEIKIVRSALKLFLQDGYTNTTFRKISADSDVKLGVITYHFRTKEDLLQLFMEELLDYHADIIDDANEETGDILYAYSLGIAIRIAICEINKKAWDIYHAGYSHPLTYEHIKAWASEKNYHLFKDMLPRWTQSDFQEKEIITSGIEFAAMKSFCDKTLTLDKKISLFLDCLLSFYEVPKEKRKETIEKILAQDYMAKSQKLFEKFAKRLDNDIDEI